MNLWGRVFKSKEVKAALESLVSEGTALQNSDDRQASFAFRIAEPKVRGAILDHADAITKKIRDKVASPRVVVHMTIVEVFESDLEAGHLHSGPGELSTHGKALLALCQRSFRELELEGVRTRETSAQEMNWIRKEIAQAG